MKRARTVTFFRVWCNDKHLGTIPATKRAAREFIRDRARIGTHMGQWIKKLNGYEYATTVGQYYQFNRERE